MEFFTDLFKQDNLAFWGAGLSTVLGGIKLYEAFRDRWRIELSLATTSLAEIGNILTIRNLAKTPIIISYWEIFHSKCDCYISTETPIIRAEWDDRDIIIPAHSNFEMEFSDENYFSTNHAQKAAGDIYLRLHIAGRRPYKKKIYKFS